MKWSKKELVNLDNCEISFEEKLTFTSETFLKNDRLRDLKDILVKGVAIYDHHKDALYVKYQVSGTMVVPCSITLEDVDYKFVAADNETYSFLPVNDKDDAIYVKGDIVDIMPEVYETIMAEIPWIVHKEGLKELPKGEGWEVVSEKDLAKEEKGIDPRLAKILEYKQED